MSAVYLIPAVPVIMILFLGLGSYTDLKHRRHRFEDRQRLREANWRAGDRRR